MNINKSIIIILFIMLAIVTIAGSANYIKHIDTLKPVCPWCGSDKFTEYFIYDDEIKSIYKCYYCDEYFTMTSRTVTLYTTEKIK